MFQVLSSCPKHNCNCGRPFPLAKRKNNFSGPEKLFFIFTFQAPLRAASELFRCFSSCPKRNCNCGRPFPLAKRKNNFSGPEKLFFIFTFQAPLRAASELFRCFSSCPKRNCNCGRPFQLAKEKTTFQALKSCSPPVRWGLLDFMSALVLLLLLLLSSSMPPKHCKLWLLCSRRGCNCFHNTRWDVTTETKQDVKGSSAFAEDEVVNFETLFNEARG